MKQYLILLKGKKHLDYSVEELEKRMQEYRVWVAKIESHYVSDNRLERIGVHIKEKDEMVTDGPFLEAKEIIAGFIIIRTETLNQAIEVANSCPLLKYFEILLRPIISDDD